MSTPTTERKQLGKILIEAGLITPGQLAVALNNQQHFHYLIGEIIALHGWVDKETIEFFAEQWFNLTIGPNPMPIGHYLQMANLLDQGQIDQILQEQGRMGLRFGAMAVLKGWVKQETMDYFLIHLKTDMAKHSAFHTCELSMTTVEALREAKKSRAQKTQSHHKTRPHSKTQPSSGVIHGESTIELPPELWIPDRPLQDGEDFDLASVLEMDEGNICY